MCFNLALSISKDNIESLKKDETVDKLVENILQAVLVVDPEADPSNLGFKTVDEILEKHPEVAEKL